MKRILYIEDSSTSQLIVRKFVEKMGLGAPTIAPSPKSATQLLNSQIFDLIITDFLFPEGDAMELIRHIRNSPALKFVPIIVVSSSMDDAMLSRVLNAGANDALSKPMQSTVFSNMVQQMLSKPYIRRIERSVHAVNCFQWFDGEMHHEFCPELNLTLSDADRERLTDRMTKVLQEKAAGGHLLGYTSYERVISHHVQNE